MKSYKAIIAAAALGLSSAAGVAGLAGCHGDFLTGGELSTDPNNPTTATKSQLFQGAETVLWTTLGSDMPRVTGIFVQQFRGGQSQYQTLNDNYAIDENTTNGTQNQVYSAGGLVDIVKLEKAAAASSDTIFLGIARVQEGMLMGTAADLFGDLVYSQALQNTPNPKLDDQLTVYDSVQKVLSAAIVNLA
ncbi:MAG TPA: SusD/RagB family nutrient-binding outer membrane lipoprotein, partial [Candidatus Elarobacter sp.]|nr:SusD/RagB family nutrient-binding outer membrane lipoprotein [Candidatus Elarobacter sp.]